MEECCLRNITKDCGTDMMEHDFEKWWNTYMQNYFKLTGHMDMPLREAARLGFLQGVEYAKENLNKEYRCNGVIE